MVKLSFLSKNLDYKNLTLTLLITVFVFSMNLNINKNLKLIFLFLSLVICIYDVKYLIPFIISFLIITSINYQKLSNKKDIKETFSTEGSSELTEEQTEFRNEIRKLPFFSNSTDMTAIEELSKKFNTPQDLFNALYLDEIDDNETRDGYVPILDNMGDPLKKKISILFSLSSRNEYNNFINKKASEMGFLKIINGSMDPVKPRINVPERPVRKPEESTVNFNTRESEYETLIEQYNQKQRIIDRNYDSSSNELEKIKRKIKECCLIYFIKNFQDNESSSDKNINKIVDTGFSIDGMEQNNYKYFNFKLDINDFLDNTDFTRKINTVINFDFNILKKKFILIDFPPDKRRTINDKLDFFYDTQREGADPNIKEMKISVNFSNFEDKLNIEERRFKNIFELYFSEVNDVINDLKLFEDNLKRIYDTNEKNKTNLILHSNIYKYIIFLNQKLQTELIHPLLNDNQTAISDEFIRNRLITIHDKLEDLSIDEDKFKKITKLNIFYNSLFLYFQNKKPNLKPLLYVEQLLEEYEAPEESPPPSSEREEPLWYEDSDLKKYFDINEMNNKNEIELDKYYKAMDFDKTKLEEISKHAEQYTEKVKAENISFDKKVDNFSHDVFQIIDEFVQLFNEVIHNTNSPSPSPGISDLEGYDYFIFVFKRIIEIITKEDRILSVGFIFIVIALFIYFIDSTKSDNINQTGGYISLLDYLNKIKI